MTLWYAKTQYALEDASAAVRRLLAVAFEREYGAGMPAIGKTSEGRPFFPSRPGIFVSLSHSGEHLLCALGEAPVGCDVQLRRELHPGTAEKLMDEREKREFEFFELWCLRESFVKMCGGGSLRRARFRLEQGTIVAPEPAAVCRIYRGIEGCACAACVLGIQPPTGIRRVDLFSPEA